VDHLGVTLEVKSVDTSQRIITAYAAVAGNLDRVGDIIDPGAFTKCLQEKPPTAVSVFISHKTDDLAVGVCQAWQFDGKGLLTETKVFDGPAGDNLLANVRGMMAVGRQVGASIGYRTRKSAPERYDGKLVRRLLDIDVMEYSFADSSAVANTQALVVGVKAGKQASEYHVAQQADGWHVIDDDDGDDLGTFDSQAEAQTALEALVTEANESDDAMPMMNGGKPMKTLPDSAFLYIQAGGVLDDEGKTVPGHLRRFPYRDADGAVDVAALAQAVDALATPPADLEPQDAQRLAGRARRLLADATSGQKTLAAEALEWQQGAVPQLAYIGYEFLALADALAARQKAQTLLGEDTKAGTRMQASIRAKMDQLIALATDIKNWAEYVDAEKDAAAKVAYYQRSLEMLALDVAS
jgi:HK97 family phage prohead protease